MWRELPRPEYFDYLGKAMAETGHTLVEDTLLPVDGVNGNKPEGFDLATRQHGLINPRYRAFHNCMEITPPLPDGGISSTFLIVDTKRIRVTGWFLGVPVFITLSQKETT